MRNVKRDRDAAVERLLREAQRPVATASTDSCLDSETMAAWSDGALNADQRAAAEAHAADCARCQAMLAAMESTSFPAPAQSWWRARVAWWLVPLSAAAAALIVWTVVPRHTPIRSRGEPAAPVDTLARASAAAKEKKSDEVRRTEEFASNEPAGRAASARRQRGDTVGRSAGGVRLDTHRDARSSNQRTAAAEAAPASADASADRVPAPQTAGVVGGAAGSPAAPIAPMNSAVTGPQSSAAKAAARPLMDARREQSSEPLIVSSPSNGQWRVVTGRPVQAIERSTDGGSTWQAQQLGGPVTVTAGASPSPTVCWLVGPRGVVLLSVDGTSWRRLDVAERLDLVAVHATDGKTAVVTAADGGTFRTVDSGLSWTRFPPR